jgi:hypothetical protein
MPPTSRLSLYGPSFKTKSERNLSTSKNASIQFGSSSNLGKPSENGHHPACCYLPSSEVIFVAGLMCGEPGCERRYSRSGLRTGEIIWQMLRALPIATLRAAGSLQPGPRHASDCFPKAGFISMLCALRRSVYDRFNKAGGGDVLDNMRMASSALLTERRRSAPFVARYFSSTGMFVLVLSFCSRKYEWQIPTFLGILLLLRCA